MPTNAPAGTNDFVYPGLIEQKEAEAIDEADQEALNEISNPIVRDLIPTLDLDAGADTAWDGDTEGFNVTPDSTTGPGEFEVYEIDSDTGRADERVLAVYGFEIITGGEFVEAVNFAASDGQTFERAQIPGLDESGDALVDHQAVLRSPIKFAPQENGAINLVVNGDFDSDGGTDEIYLKLLAVTAEKEGRRLGTRN